MSDTEKKPSENPPIMLSNLETNILESFGEADEGSLVTFTQNTVPFDFDGTRILWLQYLTRDVREVYIYEFSKKEKTTIATFAKRDGIISHMRFLGAYLFYVKDTKNILCFDMRSKTCNLIATTRDAVIALTVTRNSIREHDRIEEEKLGQGLIDEEIDEESKFQGTSYTLCCLDESENIYVIKGADSAQRASVIQGPIK